MSTIFKRAAIAVAERENHTCLAITAANEYDNDDERDNGARDRYVDMFSPGEITGTVNADGYWNKAYDSRYEGTPGHVDIRGYSTHNQRVLALLLAHQMEKTGDLYV